MDWQDKTLYERIIERWDEKETVYDRLNTARDTICSVFRPDLNADVDDANDMLQLGGDISEGSGPWVARTAAAGFQGNTVSKQLDWILYKMKSSKAQGVDQLDVWCQDVKDHMMDVYQRSTFYDTQAQFTLNGFTVGSPLMFGEEDIENDGRIIWIPLHYKTYRLYYDRANYCYGVIIKDTWSVKDIFDKFCTGQTIEERRKKAENKFSIALLTSIKSGQYNKKFTIWRAVFPKSDPIFEGEWDRPLGIKKSYWSVYFEDAVLKEKQNIPLLSDGYFSKPFVNWDYDKKLGESSSRTPAFEAIYDNLSLQQIFKNYLKHMQYAVEPSMAVLPTMKNKKFTPGKLIAMEQNEWNYIPKPIERLGDISLESATADMFFNKLSRHFHLELYRQFTDYALAHKQPPTATQILEMAGEKVTLLLPAIETHEGYLSQVDSRTMDIERQAGHGPFDKNTIENIYDIILYYTQKDTGKIGIEPEFVGTLRQTQQLIRKLKPIQYGISMAKDISLSLGDPDLARLVIRGYDTLDDALTAVNFAQKNIRPREEYEELQAMLEQARAKQQQFANALEAIKASKNLQGPVDQNSVLGMLTGAGAEAA